MGATARTAAKDAKLSLLGGLMTLVVDVLPAKIAEERIEFKLICPDEDEPTKPVQRYVHPDDVDGTGPIRMWPVGELNRAREIDGILYPVTDDDIAEAKETLLPSGEMEVTFVPAEQFEARSRPSGMLYRLRPKAQPKVYAAVYAEIDALSDVAAICELTMRGSQRLYRLQAWNGALVLQEQVRPGEFYDGETYNLECDERLRATLHGAIEAQVVDFDPEGYVNFLRQRAQELDEAKRDPNAPKPERKAKVVEDSTDDLIALLEASAAAAKAKKPARAKK